MSRGVPQPGTPSFHLNRIVWQDNRNGNSDIYLYDLATGTESQITTNAAFQMYPVIYGDKIVWQDGRNGNYDIYMYDLVTGTETQLTTYPANQVCPSIYGDKMITVTLNENIYPSVNFEGIALKAGETAAARTCSISGNFPEHISEPFADTPADWNFQLQYHVHP